MKYAFIRSQSKEHKLVRLCKALNVSTSGYYDWLERPESDRSRKNRQLVKQILAFYGASQGIYGSPRIHIDLQDAGEKVGVNRVARLMREAGIQSKMAKKFVITTDSKNTLTPAPDRLKRCFDIDRINSAWVSDTTFIPTREGWLFLAVVLDLFSRQVIGWSMGDRNNAELVIDALMMAIARRKPSGDVIVHSDQGSTYASGDYQSLISDSGLVCSMSRKGECLDNAVAESFFGTLKTELTDHENYRTKAHAKRSLFEYMEVFYNRRRRHSYVGYVPPAIYEEQCASN
ncbi:MAG: IS3 family transposase [Candidatus Thiodiazotropha sp. (ex Lucinoma borealis)]|nr:IS3 family transposase [Candidatus Thiodiazotropha sp. (ex Lucinoma borealis)]MCU7869357.1 IS3 family transposase [Candidatus Thiodiazotropha sp. (ex Lucinoma borealis)]